MTKAYYFILMEDVSKEYYQNVSINEEQAVVMMKGMALFHAHFWKRPEIERLKRGSFWVLERRVALGGRFVFCIKWHLVAPEIS